MTDVDNQIAGTREYAAIQLLREKPIEHVTLKRCHKSAVGKRKDYFLEEVLFLFCRHYTLPYKNTTSLVMITITHIFGGHKINLS